MWCVRKWQESNKCHLISSAPQCQEKFMHVGEPDELLRGVSYQGVSKLNS